MPLIRYRTDDMAEVSYPNDSEGSFSCIDRMIGRKTTLLRRKDGTYVLSLSLMNMFRKDWIRKFQVIQHSYEDLEVVLVIDGTPEEHEQETREISDLLKSEIGTVCRFTFRDEIQTDNVGKYQFVKTELK
jgi:phenylacetate-coenzyme A ligase PaaK-like adenylate-forming protein